MKIVEIKWHDARNVDGWTVLKEFEEELSLIHSAGYLIKENEYSIFVSAAIALDKFGEDAFACTIVIPKKMIIV